MFSLSKLFSKKQAGESSAAVRKQSDSEESTSFSKAGYLGLYTNSVVLYNETFAKRSFFTGEYMHCSEFYMKEGEIASFTGLDERFKDFEQAYNAFCELERKDSMNNHQYLMACNSLVIIFNSQYTGNFRERNRNFNNDYPRFFAIVKRMLMFDLPILIKADLYRQVSLFKKCVELLDGVNFGTDYERELCDEIRYRACNAIRYPFMIYDVDNLSVYCNAADRPDYLDWFFKVHYCFTLGKPILRTVRVGESWAPSIR